MDTITTTHKHHHSKSDTPTAAKIYLIRHGEKPPKLPSVRISILLSTPTTDSPQGDDAPGLSAQGIKRAQGLISVFSPSSIYNIAQIIAQHPHKHEKEARPYETILPLSESLGLTPDIDIERDDAQGAADLCLKLAQEGGENVLLCWEHGVLGKIVKALGVEDEVVYPGDRYDVIWLVWDKNGDGQMVLEWVGSEGVPGYVIFYLVSACLSFLRFAGLWCEGYGCLIDESLTFFR